MSLTKLGFDRIVKGNDLPFFLLEAIGQDRNLHSHLCTETTKKMLSLIRVLG